MTSFRKEAVEEAAERLAVIMPLLRNDYAECSRLGMADDNWMRRIMLAAVNCVPALPAIRTKEIQ